MCEDEAMERQRLFLLRFRELRTRCEPWGSKNCFKIVPHAKIGNTLTDYFS